MADVVRGNAQLYTLQYVGVTDPDMLRRAFHSAQVPPDGFNRGHYRNPEVDRLIDLATAALDETERGQLYREIQKRIAADAPYVDLWTKVNVAVAQPTLSGITLSPTADFSFLKDVVKSRDTR
jgi:peptide/nickel transport system substrate-binding protein